MDSKITFSTKRSTLLVAFLSLFFFNTNINAQCSTGACQLCNIQAVVSNITGATVTTGTSTVPGGISGGGSGIGSLLEVTSNACGIISMNVTLTFDWGQGTEQSWLHGVAFNSSPGWTVAQGNNPGAGWIFQDNIVGDCSGAAYGTGFYYDGTTQGSNCQGPPVPGDPSDNYGINPTNCCPTFSFSLEFCPSSTGTVTEAIQFSFTDDGETGGWDQPSGCVFDVTIPITLNSVGTNLPASGVIGPVCAGEALTLDAGIGCSNYDWGNGLPNAPVIQVSPMVTTTYCVTATSGMGCQTVDCVDVLVEQCCEAMAGTVTTDCNGGTPNAMVTGYNPDPAYTQTLLLTDASGTIVEIIFGSVGAFASPILTGYNAYSYNYDNVNNCGFPITGFSIAFLDCSATGACGELSGPFPITPCCTAMAGAISANSSTVCPSGTITATATGFDAASTEAILLVDPTGTITDVASGATGAFSFSGATCSSTYQVCSYNYASGASIPVAGVPFSSLNCGVDCCDVICATINVEDNEPPIFPNPPASLVNIDCPANIPPPAPLIWTDNCDGTGMATPIETGTADCSGGTITRTWDYTDACGNFTTHVQVIVVAGDNEAAIFNNLPANITVSCASDAPPMGDLTWIDNCDGTGISAGTETNNNFTCIGTIFRTWEYTDACGNLLNYTQIIDVTGDNEPALFINPPATISVATYCDVPPMGDLTWTDNCDGTGISIGQEVDNANVCTGGTVVRVWEYTDACGNLAQQTQAIIVGATPAATLQNLPADMVLNCGDALPAIQDLMYDNGLTGACQNTGVIAGTIQDFSNGCTGFVNYIWSGMDNCGNPLTHTQTISFIVPCAPFYDITGTASGIADYESSGNITSTQIIQSGASVDYDSATDIDLNAGFEVILGAIFEAFIDINGCNNGGGGSVDLQGEAEQK